MNIKTIIWSRRGIFIAALLGLFASSYLLYTYTTGADLKCGSLIHGCDVVRLSEWASLFGIPTPAFGVFFYLSVIIILIARAFVPEYKPKLARLGQVIFAVAGILESTFLTYIQAFEIGQYCTWCLASALSATLIFVFVIFDRSYSLTKDESNRELKFIGAFLAIFVVFGGLLFARLVKPVESPPINPVFIQDQIEPPKPESVSSTTEQLMHIETSTTLMHFRNNTSTTFDITESDQE